ncbi:MAG: LptF/LptG family permease [Calditrichaceae bacterium]
MPILDKYILKRFFTNLIIAILTWIVIFLVVDIIEHISKFIDKQATVQQFILYYIYYIPYIISLTLPVAMLLSSLFTLSVFAQNNEIVAQLSSGISLYRLLMPLFIVAMITGFFNELVVPAANQKRLDLYRYDISGNTRPEEKSRSNIYRQDAEKRKFIIKYFNGKTNEARSVSIQIFDGPTLVQRIDAEKMIWAQNYWMLLNGKVRTFKGEKEQFHTFKDSAFYNTNLKPENLVELQKKPEEMSFSELNRFIAELQSIGADTKKWIVERQLKISMPFSNFIVVLLGAPLASRKRRGGIGLNFALSLLVSFIYFVIIRFGQVMGHQGDINPVLGAWFGNLIFFSLGLYGLFAVRK